MKNRVYSTVRLPYEYVLELAEMERVVVVKNPEGFADPLEVTGFESSDGYWYSPEKVARNVIAILVSEGAIADVDWKYRYDAITLAEDTRNSTAELELYVTIDVTEELIR